MILERSGLLSRWTVAIAFWIIVIAALGISDGEVSNAKYRQPTDLLLDATNEHLFVACSGTGELEIYQTRTNQKIACVKLDKSLNALASLGGEWIAACSTKSNRTHILRWTAENLQRVATISNSHSPVGLCWDPEKQCLFVACLWSRRIEAIELTDKLRLWGTENRSASTSIESIIPNEVWDVPIAPRKMTCLGSSRGLAVTDSFGRELLVLNSADGQVIAKHDFFGTSIRGLAVEGKELIVLHAMLNEFARAEQSEIHWGVLMSNDVRMLDVDLILKERGDRIYHGVRAIPVGVPGSGSAEPTDMAVHKQSGKIAVSVGGTDMIAIGRIDGYSFSYLPVGRYPSAVKWSSDGQMLYVANQFEDSISVVDASANKVLSVISQGTMRKLSEPELGEQLFHSATLSHDRWLTCASCHVDGHTNGQLSDNFGDRSFGAPKRVPSLLGVKGTAPYTWLGHEEKLKGQIVSSVQKTMHSYRKLDDDEVDQIAAYMESLPPVISLSEARGKHLDEAVLRGKLLFESRGCADCHAAPTYTSHDVYDVGVVDEMKQKLFNPPSLRGVSQRGPELFHDCRADGIRGVLINQKHRLKEQLSDQQVTDLIAFLNTL